MYQVIFTKQADRTLRKLPRTLAQRIRAKIDAIAVDPCGRHSNMTKLVDRPGYRLRVGDWRALYELKDEHLVLLVLKSGPRGDVYE